MPAQKRGIRRDPGARSSADQEELSQVYAGIRATQARLIGGNGQARPLPPTLRTFLLQLQRDLTASGAVAVVDDLAEITTAEAARMLSVSRQFFVNLLEGGSIPFHKVGTHRRVYARDVSRFKALRDSARRKALDSLARSEMKEALYDRVPMHASDTRS